jgi:hypothetical protein
MVAVLSLFLGWILLDPVPSTQELDSDLEKVRSEMKAASTDSDKYSSGLIKSFIDLRKATLQNTEAMLVQKRTAILRRINLDYRIDGASSHPASGKELDDINEEIQRAERKLAQSVSNAQQYSGGLIQMMALATVETDKLAVSTLRLKFYLAKYGLPVGDFGKPQPPPSPGHVVKDRDAL